MCWIAAYTIFNAWGDCPSSKYVTVQIVASYLFYEKSDAAKIISVYRKRINTTYERLLDNM